MLMTPIEPPLPRSSWRVVRLLRRWATGAELGAGRIPSLVRLGSRIGVDAQAAVALASLFQLTEACLGRPLAAECCCSRSLGSDERAVLIMLGAAVPARPHQALPPIPHGLPGALVWAVASVRQLMGSMVAPAATSRCPFTAG